MAKHADKSDNTNPRNSKDRKPEHAVPELPKRKGDGSGGKPTPNPKGTRRL